MGIDLYNDMVPYPNKLGWVDPSSGTGDPPQDCRNDSWVMAAVFPDLGV